MNLESRIAIANSVYNEGLNRVATKPQPKGQKFSTGTRVKIADDLGSGMSHFRKGVEAEVEYTYAHAYGGNDVKSYSLKFDDGNTSAWYKEWQLTEI